MTRFLEKWNRAEQYLHDFHHMHPDRKVPVWMMVAYFLGFSTIPTTHRSFV